MKSSHASSRKHTRRDVLQWLDDYLRYTNYIGAAQLYLKENCLLRDPLKIEHIKDRILGHWGTVPGLNFIYAHLNYLIYKHRPEMLFIAGPGHGAPGVIANLFGEGTLEKYYPTLRRDEAGTSELIRMFSWPGGFPSHTNPGTPGAILEGGELGYSLGTAYGAVLDNPHLIAACVVGDGESETGPLAAAWHSNKYLNPAESGAVLPIVHINGYKITGPTIFGTMSDAELCAYFTGLGYEPLIVDCCKISLHAAHNLMIDTLEHAYQRIRKIQDTARGRGGATRSASVQRGAARAAVLKPRWPVILLRSLKGWSGIKTMKGHKIEGTYHAHGIPAAHPQRDPEQFRCVKRWLESYRFTELIDVKGRPLPEVLRFVPHRDAREGAHGDARMGMSPYTIGGNMLKNLKLPAVSAYAVACTKEKCDLQVSSTVCASHYIRDLIVANPKNFRFMCPDETESNKFTSLFEVTQRAFMWPVKSYDEHIGPWGRVMEILSEHTLQGWLQGYLLTGRHGIFATYEAFATIVASMVDQYAKFLKQSAHVPWRKPLASLNYLLTSVGWRQEHNGYSHQNPSFISNLLEKHGAFSSVYFPCDANSLLVILEDCFKRRNGINVIACGKQTMPQWMSLDDARRELRHGVGRWDWIDRAAAANPDIVLAACGDVMVQESMAAFDLLRKELPEARVRFVNVSELTALGIGDERHPLSLDNKDFYHYFTKDRPVIFNFHGYPAVIQRLMYGHEASSRFSIHGYIEVGTTTTPFDMVVLNKTSRFHIAIDALEHLLARKPKLRVKIRRLLAYCHAQLKKHAAYIRRHGTDMPEIEAWRFIP